MMVVVVGVIALYLGHNQALTGYITGMPREPPTDAWSSRLAMLAGAVWSQLVVGTYEFSAANWASWTAAAVEAVALISLGLVVHRHYRAPLRQLRLDPAAIAFLATGLLYLGAIVVLRWRNEFDPYDFRLLGPGSLLLTIALVRTALTSWPAARFVIAGSAAVLAGISLTFALAELPRPWRPRYAATVAAIQRRYAGIPAGAIVAFGNDDLRYLRPDLFVAMPLCPPWFLEHETWAEFLGRIDRSRPIFLDVHSPPLDLSQCDASIRQAVAGYLPGELVPLGVSQTVVE
jgi:hypothetical protein